MKVRFPLWLKVSTWLVANLAFLGAVGAVLFYAQLRSGRSSISGAASSRVEAISNNVRRELARDPGRDRDELLAGISESFGVEFLIVGLNGEHIAGPAIPVPAEVTARIGELRPPIGGPGGGRPDFGGRGGRGGPPGGGFQGGGGRGQGGRGNFPPQEYRSGPAPGATATASTPTPPPGRGSIPPDVLLKIEAATKAAKEGNAAAEALIVRTFRGPPPQGNEASRFMMPAGTRFWIGTRFGMPVPNDFRDRDAVLLAVSDSLEAAGLIIDFHPLFYTAAAVAALSILFWLPMVFGVTRSLRRVTHATEQIAEGRFDTRVNVNRSDELGRLGEAVNGMAGRLDTLVNGQKRFLGDIAHELGSPVARMQFATSILEERADPGLQPAVQDVREEVQNMSELVNELLAFTRAGLKPKDAVIADVELAPIVAKALDREEAGARAVAQVPADLKVRCDAALLSKAVNNLVRNAMRYAADGGPIAIEAQKIGDKVKLTIADQGPGVPPEALARLGEPFYRPETARTRETGGVGLGLAIVKSAIQACQGEIKFSNRTPHGFSVEITLQSA